MRDIVKIATILLAAAVAGGCSARTDNALEDEMVGSERQAVVTEAAGFALVANLNPGPLSALPGYSYNATGATNVITWTDVGRARVDFPGLGNEQGGNVQVSAWLVGQRCKVEGWVNSGGTLQAFVRCFTFAGVPQNQPFLISYVRRAGTPGIEGGYVWANDPTSPAYTPQSSYQWNSAGSAVSITRSGTGAYSVRFPGQNFVGGTVEVSAYGIFSEFCKVVNWGPSGSDQIVNVQCFDTSGTPIDTKFTAKFTRGALDKTNSYAYAWANQPTTASYSPSSTYQSVVVGSACGSPSVRGPINITRPSLGRYDVRFAGSPSGLPGGIPTHAKVTAYGPGTATCRLAPFSTGPSPANDAVVSVECFDTNGAPVDSLYVITFSSLTCG